MKTRPILFSTPMIKAIMNGSKTQTRRIIKSKEELISYEGCLDDSSFWKEPFLGRHLWQTKDGEFSKKPKYEEGDIIWVRETFCEMYNTENHPELEGNPTEKWSMGFGYKADGEPEYMFDKWKPSIFMPKEACRNFLKTTKVRVERVQNISEEDAIAEGVQAITAHNDSSRILGYHDYTVDPKDGFNTFFTAKESFESLWISINGQESWDENPFVFVYDFHRTIKPKDFL